MSTIRDELHVPAILAMIDYAQDHQVIVAWNDGGEALVYFDTFLPADESDDGSEEVIVRVVETFHMAPSVSFQSELGDMVISSNDAPTTIISPDRSRSWTAQPA